MEKHFHECFNRLSPSVTGIYEAFQRITEVEHGELSQSLEVQSDLTFTAILMKNFQNLIKLLVVI